MRILSNNLYLAYIKQTYSAILVCTLIIISVYALSLSNFFKQVDNLIYNQFSVNYPASKASEKIFLIEVDDADLAKGDEIWLKTLDILLNHHAKAIAFTFLPQQASKDFYQKSIQSNKVFFARHLLKKIKKNVEYKELESNANIDVSKLQIGILTAEPYANGIYSSQQTDIKLDNQSLPSLEFLVAEKLNTDLTQLAQQTSYQINFSGGIAKFPSADMERVLKNGLISELVQNRVVMIGTHNNSEINQYITPITSADDSVSAFFYHAFALDTLLSGKIIQPSSTLFKLSLITIIVIASFFIYQWLSIKQSLWVTLLILPLYIVITWVGLHFFQWWLPLSEISISQCLIFFLVTRHKAIQEDQVLHSTLFDISIRLQEKLSHASFLYVEDHWQQVITMVSQTLDTNRMIFLERIENDHRLQEIKSLNCSLDDIDEQRRDYERRPYSTAINENAPIVVHDYLKKSNIIEDEYLVPLVFSGEILGFWAFTITSDKINLFPNFITTIKNIAVQISAMLHYRKAWQQKQKLEQNVLLSYLSFSGGQINHDFFKESVYFLDKRMDILESLFNSLSSCCVLYDLFGRVVLMNNPMKEFAQKSDIKPYTITIIEFIADLTGHSLTECRGLMRYVILDREEITIPAINIQKQGCYMLNIKPLLTSQYDTNIPEIAPFQIEGVLCELIDYSAAMHIVKMKEKLFEKLYYRLRNSFSSVLLAKELLKNDDIDALSRKTAINSFVTRINQAKDKIEQLFVDMHENTVDLLQDRMTCYPIDGYEVLSKTVTVFQSKIQNINFNIDKIEGIDLVFASPSYFEEIVENILDILIEDTIDDGQIMINVTNAPYQVIYKFSNTGFGMPNEVLQEYLNTQNQENISDRIREVRQAIHHVNKWKGDLQISSVLGEGTTILMTLKKFIGA